MGEINKAMAGLHWQEANSATGTMGKRDNGNYQAGWSIKSRKSSYK